MLDMMGKTALNKRAVVIRTGCYKISSKHFTRNVWDVPIKASKYKTNQNIK